MRDWFYTKAKFFKQAAFFMSGTAVALSTATAISSATTSWITNLIAIVGGGAYSSFKNMETARAIIEQEKNIQQLVARLSLEDYQEDDSSILLSNILGNISSLGAKADDVIKDIDRTIEELNKSLAKKYAAVNWITQIAAMVTTVIINTLANAEDNEEGRNNPLAIKNILNMTVVPFCILAQYLLHTSYTAKNLRKMATETENLERILLRAKESLVFRTKEYRMFWQRGKRVEVELRECEQRITAQTTVQQAINDKIKQGTATREDYTSLTVIKEALQVLEKDYLELCEKHKSLSGKESNFNQMQEILTHELEMAAADLTEANRVRQ